MQELVIKIIYLVFYAIAGIGRARFAVKSRKIKAVFSIKKTREYSLIFLSSSMMILPLIYVFSDWIDSFNAGFPLFVRIIGGVGFAFAVFLHNRTHRALGVNWSPVLEIKKGQKLITTGPYEYVRHPMYAAFFFWAFFQGLFLSNWLILVVGTVSFLIVYLARVQDEERMMLKRFGKRYEKYVEKTGRLFPKIL